MRNALLRERRSLDRRRATRTLGAAATTASSIRARRSDQLLTVPPPLSAVRSGKASRAPLVDRLQAGGGGWPGMGNEWDIMPRPRGPDLRGDHLGPVRGHPAARRHSPDPFGDDLHLSLYVCYELHYQGFDDVDPEWEWDPPLLGLRRDLERGVYLKASPR